MFNICDYGAVSHEDVVNTEAIEATIAACREVGGGTIYVPPGTYRTGSIELFSHMRLVLDAHATLSFIDDPAAYPLVNTRWEGAEQLCYRSCIYATDAADVVVSGQGTIEGNGARWWREFRAKEHAYPRPTLLSFVRCTQVSIKELRFQNSPSWTIHPLFCADVSITDIHIHNPKDSPNTDGINPESSSNVRISGCYIDVGDDCIAIKAGVEQAEAAVSCRNIAISNCTMINGHGGVVIGSEMSGGVEQVVISNCIFEGTDRGIRLKSRRGRGGFVRDVLVSNVVMNEVICPFIMNLYYFCGPGGKEAIVSDKAMHARDATTPTFHDIHFNNIIAKNVHAAAGFMYGLAEAFIHDVSYTNVMITLKEDGLADYPAMMDGLEPMKQRGFYCWNVKDVQFHNVKVKNQVGGAFVIDEQSTVEITSN